MTLLFVYAGIALSVSFLCSILEAALLSVTPAHLAKLEQDRPKVGGRLRALKGHVDRPLAAILTLNTTANTVGAAGVGAEAQRLWGSEVLAITSAALTLLILFLAEIIPKTLGARLALGETDRLSQATASLR
jgi:Mg2+/Co2+ transporter CorB